MVKPKKKRKYKPKYQIGDIVKIVKTKFSFDNSLYRISGIFSTKGKYNKAVYILKSLIITNSYPKNTSTLGDYEEKYLLHEDCIRLAPPIAQALYNKDYK